MSATPSVYAVDTRQAERMRAQASLPADAIITDDWDRLEDMARTTACSVVLIEWLHTSQEFGRLLTYKHTHPLHPVVLVTRWDPANARHLKDIVVEEVVWWREVPQELRHAVECTCRSDYNFVRCLALPIEQSRSLPATLRSALAYACRSERAVRSVEALAAAAGCDRRTLWHQWKKAGAADARLRMQDFLHWLLLLRAMGRKTPRVPWSRVADEIGVTATTLGRFSRQLTGRTLRELEHEDALDLARRFRARMLDALVGEAPDVVILEAD